MRSRQELKVLVVEDDAFFLEILADTIRPYCGEVFSAANGKEALKIVVATPVDLIVSDVQMPVMGGDILVKKLRAIHNEIPIILLITGESQFDEAGARALGANGMLHKPLNAQLLIDTVCEFLDKAAG